MAAQTPLVGAAARIEQATGKLAGYGGIAITVQHRTVLVYWHGRPPAAADRLFSSLRRRGIRVLLKRARYSRRQVIREIDRLIRNRKRLMRSGVKLMRLSPHPDYSGITVAVSYPHVALAAAATITEQQRVPRGVERLVRHESHVALSVVAATPTAQTRAAADVRPAKAADRLRDGAPFFAGAAIETQSNSNWCSSGFPMRRRSDGRTFITTAYHCVKANGDQPYQQWWAYGSLRLPGYRVGEVWSTDSWLDVSYIRPPAGQVAAYVYNGTLNDPSSSAQVVGVGSNVVGEHICTSGAATGQHCGIVITGWTVMWLTESNYFVGEWLAQAVGSDPTAGGDGDSGGPVYTYDGAHGGGVLALGTQTGGFGKQFSCPADIGGVTLCDDSVVFADEQAILDSNDADILTANSPTGPQPLPSASPLPIGPELTPTTPPTTTPVSTPPPTRRVSAPATQWAYQVIGICANPGCGLIERTGPGASNLPTGKTYRDGDNVEIVCQKMDQAQTVTDPSTHNSSAVWDKLADGGWVSDLYVNTPAPPGQFSNPPITNSNC